MSSKFEPQALCAGMRVGVEFLSRLSKALEKNGASAHMIHFMTLPQNAAKFEEWVKFGVAQLYPIPRSLIEELVDTSQEDEFEDDPEYGTEVIASDRIYWWDRINLEETFGIPILQLDYPLPKAVLEQIVGVALREPHIIEHRGEAHIVVNIYYEGSLTPRGGRPMPGLVYKDQPTSITLAPAKYFDLDH